MTMTRRVPRKSRFFSCEQGQRSIRLILTGTSITFLRFQIHRKFLLLSSEIGLMQWKALPQSVQGVEWIAWTVTIGPATISKRLNRPWTRRSLPVSLTARVRLRDATQWLH